MLDSSIAVQVAPKIYYKNEHSALAVANSKEELMTWWLTVKSKIPFNQLVADRIRDAPNQCLLRVGLGYQNEGRKINQIFKEALVTCEDLPPDNLVEFILRNLDRTYEIQGQSYQITRLISTRGSYGDVFLARDQASNKDVVIKILRIKNDKEDQMLKKLARNGYHPNIVQYIGSDVVMDKTWIVMEYIDGIMLAKYQGPWTRELEAQYQNALNFIRDAGVETERENEKENTMISIIDGTTPTLKLIDFGTLARR